MDFGPGVVISKIFSVVVGFGPLLALLIAALTLRGSLVQNRSVPAWLRWSWGAGLLVLTLNPLLMMFLVVHTQLPPPRALIVLASLCPHLLAVLRDPALRDDLVLSVVVLGLGAWSYLLSIAFSTAG